MTNDNPNSLPPIPRVDSWKEMTTSERVSALSAKIDALALDIERTAREVTSAEARLIVELGDRMTKYERELADLRWEEMHEEGYPGLPHSRSPW